MIDRLLLGAFGTVLVLALMFSARAERVEGNLGTYISRDLTGTSGAQPCHSQAAFSTTDSAIIAHGAASQRLYVCAVVIGGGGVGNAKYALVEGTGAACSTAQALIGIAATQGGGLPDGHVAAMIAPQPWMTTQTAGNQICLLKDNASFRAVGVIVYGAY